MKRRWSLKDAESAVQETVAAAAYLASQRDDLVPRKLILSCQGVDAIQYAECAVEVLKHAQPGDWFGYGGWCILGRWKSWLAEFWRTLHSTLPLVKRAGLSHVHIFGVLWPPALGGLLALADIHGLTVSTDSSKPVQDCTRADPVKAGRRRDHWRDNVQFWRDLCANLRDTSDYRVPSFRGVQRQLSLLEAA